MKRYKLTKISGHVWIYSFNSLKDRPNLGYILGAKGAVAVDAGHSSEHVKEFYDAIEEEGLPVPDLTIITHWHWDHTFGMHAVNGETIARAETNVKLKELQAEMDGNPDKAREFITSDPTIAREYAGGVPVIVVPADKEVSSDQTIDLGDVTVKLIMTESPHTDDSLLVYVREDRVLFTGDAHLGEFPTWRMDWDKLAAFAEKVRGLEADVVIDGHWRPYRKEDFMAEIGGGF